MLDEEKAKAIKAANLAYKKYNEMFAEYIKTCPHTRKNHSRNDWDRITSVHCATCGKYITNYT